jgi:hypothetical protein
VTTLDLPFDGDGIGDVAKLLGPDQNDRQAFRREVLITAALTAPCG